MFQSNNQPWDEPRLTHRDFKAFFEASNQAMFIENSNGYIVTVNPAASTLWRANINQLVGKHASEILPPKMGTCTIGKVRKSRYTRPDNTTIEVEVLSTPLTLGDNEAFLTTVWLANQETPTTNTESLSAAPATTDSSSHPDKMAALERFAERVSHDFNNILTSVIGFGSLMQTDQALSEANRGYVNQIIEAANRAEKLTTQLLAFGRPSSPPKTNFSPAAAISQADPHLRQILGPHLSLTTLCEEDIAPIAGREESLIQILMHLATNTREAMNGAAEGTMKIELSSNAVGDTLITVSDDGPGMDSWSAAAAFEPFFSTRNDQKVRGLGLTHVYSVTRDLGGTVALESTHGSGTSLKFWFPAAPVSDVLPTTSTPTEPHREMLALNQTPSTEPLNPATLTPTPPTNMEPLAPITPTPAPAPTPVRKRTPLPGGTETILVVEDEPMVREIVVRSLTHLGYTVHKACDGQEGLELSRTLEHEIDLIFSDIVMPHLSGPEMIQRIREENRNTPVLFTTGFTESKHLLENGGDLREGIDLLQKPYTPNVLAERVREKLDSLMS